MCVCVCFNRTELMFQCHIISDSNIEVDLQGLLAEDDLNVVLASKHRPRCIVEFISLSLQMLDFDEHKRSIMVIIYLFWCLQLLS